MAHFKTNDNTVEKILFQEEVRTYSPDTGNIYYQSAAMYKNKRTDIKEFVQYVLDNPNVKQSYQNFTKSGIEYTLSSDTIAHDKKRHKLSAQDWENAINSLDNIVYGEITNRKNYYGDKNIVLETIHNDTSYRFIITQSGGQNKITSAFRIEKARVPASDSSNFGSVSNDTTDTLSGLNSIINELKTNVNNNTEDAILNQNANGFFDSELKAIVLGSNFNFGTLPHEMAHFRKYESHIAKINATTEKNCKSKQEWRNEEIFYTKNKFYPIRHKSAEELQERYQSRLYHYQKSEENIL